MKKVLVPRSKPQFFELTKTWKASFYALARLCRPDDLRFAGTALRKKSNPNMFKCRYPGRLVEHFHNWLNKNIARFTGTLQNYQKNFEINLMP